MQNQERRRYKSRGAAPEEILDAKEDCWLTTLWRSSRRRGKDQRSTVLRLVFDPTVVRERAERVQNGAYGGVSD